MHYNLWAQKKEKENKDGLWCGTQPLEAKVFFLALDCV